MESPFYGEKDDPEDMSPSLPKYEVRPQRDLSENSEELSKEL